MDIGRRDFLKGAGALGLASALGASGALAGCAPKQSDSANPEAAVSSVDGKWAFLEEVPMPASDEIAQIIECDICVIGAGISGLAGALFAVDEGYDVRVLEKGSHVGLSREAAFSLNSKMQLEKGYVFDRAFRDGFLSTYFNFDTNTTGPVGSLMDNHWHNAAFVDSVGPMMDWLAPILIEEGIDVHVSDMPEEYNLPMMMSYGRAGNPPDPWQEAVASAFEKRGGVIDYLTGAKWIVREEGAGRVTGVIAVDGEGKYVEYKARLGTLIAAGGCGADEEMGKALFFNWDRVKYHFGYPTHTGDMMKAAYWIGAELDPMVWGDPFWCTTTEGAPLTRVGSTVDYDGFDDTWPAAPGVGQLPTLWTDIVGRRCICESADALVMDAAILNQPEGMIWSIWDSAWKEKFGANIPEGDVNVYSRLVTWFAMNNQEQIDSDVENGITFKCDSIEEVAQVTGMDLETLQATISEYNSFCEQGYDPVYLKDPKWLTTVDTPPYYVAGMGTAECVTRGGIHTDPTLRVLDRSGREIPGLWSAGSGTGGIWGFWRLFMSVTYVQNIAWRAIHDMIGKDVPMTEWPDSGATTDAVYK